MRPDFEVTFMKSYRKITELLQRCPDDCIFEALCTRVEEEFAFQIERAKITSEFLSFYLFLENIKDKKINYDEELLKREINSFRSTIQGYVGDVSPDIINDVIFSSSLFGTIGKYDTKRILNKIESFYKGFEKQVKQVLITCIKAMFDKLDEIGEIERTCHTSNFNFVKSGLGILNINIGQEESQEVEDIIKLKDIQFPKTIRENYNKRYLERLNLSKLILINIFICNKFVKVYERFIVNLFILSEHKNLLIGMKKGDIERDTVIYYIESSEWYMNGLISSVISTWKKGEKLDIASFFNDKIDKEKIEYIKNLSSNEVKLYIFKDILVYSAFLIVPKTKELKNYGIMQSATSYNSVVVAWDLPQYNLPIRVHVTKEKIKFFFSKVVVKEKIRRYLGDSDFKVGKYNFGTSILYYIDAEKRAKLKEIKACDTKNKLIEHILFLQTGIFPEHMKKEKELKGKTIDIKEIIK